MKDGVNNKVITCSVNYEWPAHPERFFGGFFVVVTL